PDAPSLLTRGTPGATAHPQGLCPDARPHATRARDGTLRQRAGWRAEGRVVVMALRCALAVGPKPQGSGRRSSRSPLEAPGAGHRPHAATEAGRPGESASTGERGRTIRVLIADDEYLVREGARSVLSAVPGLEVVGLAADPAELAALVDKVSPNVVVLDIRMPPTYRTEGIVAAQQIRQTNPHVGVVILSQYSD